MTKRITLTPAYGKDYKSKDEINSAFDGNLDFIIADFNHPYEGKPVNKPQLVEDGYTTINVRYHKLRKVHVIELK